MYRGARGQLRRAGPRELVRLRSAVGAEEHVENREDLREVAVAVLRTRRVVQTVQLRPAQDRRERAEREPQVRVREQQQRRQDERQQGQGQRVDAQHEQRGQRDDRELHRRLEPVGAQPGGGVQLRVGVVELVDRPQGREAVLRAVIAVEAQVSQEDVAGAHRERGADAGRRTQRQRRQVHRPGVAGGCGRDRSAQRRRRRESGSEVDRGVDEVAAPSPPAVSSLRREPPLQRREQQQQQRRQRKPGPLARERRLPLHEPGLERRHAAGPAIRGAQHTRSSRARVVERGRAGLRSPAC